MSLSLLVLSFIAGALTVAAPCILPLLPVIIGGSIIKTEEQRWYRPLIITLSLALSVIAFTLLLRATTALLGVPQMAWNVVSGVIVLLFGINLLFPTIWEKAMIATGLSIKSNQLLAASSRHKGLLKDMLLGAALGPVFSSCSPTYALIVATLLPQSLATGLLYLGAYAAGLSATLLLIALAGQALVKKMQWTANPHGWFRRTIGVLFIVVGLSVMFGLDRQLQAYIIQQGWYAPVSQLEKTLR